MPAQGRSSRALLSVCIALVSCMQACTDPQTRGQEDLIAAARTGNLQKIREVLKEDRQIDLNWQSKGTGPTALMAAVADNQIDVAVQVDLSRTALHAAFCRSKRVDAGEQWQDADANGA